MPMPARTFAPFSPAAKARKSLAACTLASSIAALMPKPVGSPKVTGCLVQCRRCRVVELRDRRDAPGEGVGVAGACWASRVATYHVPISIIAACCLPNSPW